MRRVFLRPAWTLVALLSCLAPLSTRAAAPAASEFYALAPCRLVDTRGPVAPLGGPSLAAGVPRAFDLTTGTCGVPPDATAVSLNVTAVGAASAGSLTVYPGAGAPPAVNTVSFHALEARAGSAIVGLVLGTLSVVSAQPAGAVDVVLDVNGYFAPPAPAPVPDLATWLSLHPSVAGAIKWQFRPANPSNSYVPPAESDKIAWASWSATQQSDLNQAYLDAKAWLEQGAPPAAMPIGGLTDQPANQHPQAGIDSITVMEWVTPAYMWKLYVAHVGFSLALEITQAVPWSIAGDTPETLRYLFDSSVLAWYLPNGNYGMGTYAGANFPPLRASNRPQTAFAPPMWTYPFLRQAFLVGATRLETIGNVLEWMRLNLSHYYGTDTFGNFDAVWQYRGWVPLSRIVNGTTDMDPARPTAGFAHWTAGCHGSVAFLHEVLRVVNVPVQPVWVAGHELAYFTSEKLYLDHGDDPYNAVVRSHPASPILGLLIDEATYQARFTADLTVNITDPYSPAAANVGLQAKNFH
ncbi:MAG: hypothetical protein WCC53_05090 [Thermoanaerobaculia bacterium]